jgi:hypothetical protein
MMNRTIYDLNAATAGMKRKVKVLADGSIEADGNIRSITVSKERMEKVNAQLIQEKTKLTEENEQLKSELQKAKEVKHVVSKTKVMTQWWVWALFFIAGVWARPKLKFLNKIPFFNI